LKKTIRLAAADHKRLVRLAEQAGRPVEEVARIAFKLGREAIAAGAFNPFTPRDLRRIQRN
jgi:hypothetical protein